VGIIIVKYQKVSKEQPSKEKTIKVTYRKFGYHHPFPQKSKLESKNVSKRNKRIKKKSVKLKK